MGGHAAEATGDAVLGKPSQYSAGSAYRAGLAR
jgi:hypothetical protein